jgi:glycosyltransferase involved in cell wall biosynthesis
MIRPLRVGVCPDFVEERWPSMDRVAGQLLAALGSSHSETIAAQLLRPAFRKRAMRLSSGELAYNADRACNRFIDYPRHLRRVSGTHDVYHIIDHSYAHLAWSLPENRSVVTCHDLDAFRSIVDDRHERRSAAFRAATRYILGGLQRAAAVVCDSAAIADELTRRALVSPERVFVVHLGVGEQFTVTPDPDGDASLARLLSFPARTPVVLHVGSTIPRKRIDVLLRLFAAVRRREASAQLLHAGEPLTDEQTALARQLAIADRITVLSTLDDRHLAAVYRRASVLALPSDREGFGLPVLEALRSGTAVVASDLKVLREVGGTVARYCPPGDVAAWADAVADRLLSPEDDEDRQARAAWAASFTWRRYAEQMARIYSAVAEDRVTQPMRIEASA